MRKFFVTSNQIYDNKIIINGEDVNHIKNVLRLDIGEKVKVCDKDNSINYISEITEITSQEVILNILEQAKNAAEGNVLLDIYQGLPKADKMELIIQKGTELGVNSFIPVAMKRSIVKLSGKDEDKKIERWNKISEVAAKQSGRDIVPKVQNIINMKQLLEKVNQYDLFILAYEEEKVNYIKEELKKIKGAKDKNDQFKIAIAIGPEGGLDPDEVNLLKNSGAKVVSLGKRILRTETVALQVSSIVMYELEDNEGEI